MRVKGVFLVLALGFAGAAFAGGDAMKGHSGDEKKTEESAKLGMPAGQLDEGQTVRVLGLVHATEIDLAQMALQKSDNPRLREFARELIDEHRKLDEETVAVIGKYDLSGRDSDASRQLLLDGNKIRRDLGQLDGAAFDREWLAAQVQLHEGALQLVDSRLSGGAFGTGVMDLVDQTRPALQNHLQQARDLQQVEDRIVSG